MPSLEQVSAYHGFASPPIRTLDTTTVNTMSHRVTKDSDASMTGRLAGRRRGTRFTRESEVRA